MTVQEIQEIGFEKAVFGGYDMQSVDAFLERVAEEFAAMQKENAALKAKMKVLVDKIEEYRGVEDGMRRALMSAQTIAQDTIDKAKAEAAQIVSAAKNETENKVKTTQGEIELEEQKLEAVKKNTVEFVTRISSVYQAQAKALIELVKNEHLISNQQEAQPAPQKQEVQQTAQPAPQKQEIQQAASPTAEPKPEQADAPIEDATRKFDFGELKFGADYDPNDVK